LTPYFFQIKNKETVIYTEQVLINPRSEREHTINANSFPLVNGGILSLSLYRASSSLTNLASIPDLSTVQQLLIPQGELLFFKKPNSMIRVDVQTDKQTYGAGNNL